ncbi:hypothetical protein TNCV_3931631 [Trichonephila clavipes]|nr:hypothetical protein TNCV_3931631 [Trichonephila clavipes]
MSSDLVISNLSQVTRTPELAPHSSNFYISVRIDLMFINLSTWQVFIGILQRRSYRRINDTGALNTKYIETFLIPLDKLQNALQEKLRALHKEEAFNGYGRNTTQQLNTQDADTSFVSTLGTCYVVLEHPVEIKRRNLEKMIQASQI